MTEDEVDPRDRLRAEVLSFYTGHYGETPTDEHLTRICELIEEERRGSSSSGTERRSRSE